MQGVASLGCNNYMEYSLESFFQLFVGLQIIHSLEEIYTRFDKYWPVWKMSRRFFVSFEIIFSSLLLFVVFYQEFPARLLFMQAFNLLMFANGIWHLMWAGVVKKYVPGLMTAPLFLIVFCLYYFSLLAK